MKEMAIKRCGCILVIMTFFLVAVSSGGLMTGLIPKERPSWYDDCQPFNPGYFNYDYVFFKPSGWFNYPNHILPLKPNAIRVEPDSVTMPRALSISKEELFESKAVVTGKQSVLSSLSPKGGRPTFL
jgi:hypothetical protein